MAEASPREPAHDSGQTAQPNQAPSEQAAAGQAPSSEPTDAEPETAPAASVSSWPRSIANADGRPSLFSAFPAAGQTGRAVRLSLRLHTIQIGKMMEKAYVWHSAACGSTDAQGYRISALAANDILAL